MQVHPEMQLFLVERLKEQIETYIIRQGFSDTVRIQGDRLIDTIIASFDLSRNLNTSIVLSISDSLTNGFEERFETLLAEKFNKWLETEFDFNPYTEKDRIKAFVFLVQRYKPKYKRIRQSFKSFINYLIRKRDDRFRLKILSYNQAIKNGNQVFARAISIAQKKYPLQQCEDHFQYFNLLYQLQDILPLYKKNIRDILLLFHNDALLFHKDFPCERHKRIGYYLHHSDPVFRNLLFSLFKDQIYTAIAMIKQYILDDLMLPITYLYLYSFCMQ